MKNVENNSQNSLRLTFVLIVAAILLIAIAMVIVLEYVIVLSGLSTQEELENTGTYWIFVFGSVSIIIGLGLAFLLGKLILQPFDNLLEGMARLSTGDYKVRVNFSKRKYLKSLSEGFNTLAQELDNTEILRSDFINNFSHELKTPIVSVSSLIPLLKSDDLPKAKRLKYLSVIEEEMDRLASMTTNILNLSKVENQSILTKRTEFNLSEQIRNCVLLLEKKWSKKKLNLSLDFDEYTVFANEDLLKQVWLNLLDNAVKFAEQGGDLTVNIEKIDNRIAVTVKNSGSCIPESEYTKVFNKFYRMDETSVKDGNGIGLSIVKHIVELHDGRVYVVSKDNVTAFTVEMPQK